MASAWLSFVPRAALSHLNGAPAAASRFRPEPPVRLVAVVFRPGTTGVSVAAQRRVVAVAAAAATETETAPAAGGDEVGTPFIEEMRAAAMRLHSRDQARDGKKEAPLEPPVARWQPTVERYLRFLVGSKLVFETLEAIVEHATVHRTVPWYAGFRDTGLERSEPLKNDLERFRQQGHAIPEPSAPGITYASFLEELSEKDPGICLPFLQRVLCSYRT